MSVRPRLEVRIIPSELGAHAAMSGSFTLMEFAAFSPVVYLESVASAVFLENSEQIASYQLILAALAETALSHGESKELIVALAAELYTHGEDQNDGEHLAKEKLQR